MMVGKDLVLPTRAPNESIGEAVLVVDNLTVVDDRGLSAVDGLSITVNAGEVVGIAGVSGNGQRELAQGIVGLMNVKSGSVHLSGTDVTRMSVHRKIKRGIAYVPQNRLGMGLAPGLTTEDNLALKQYREPPYSRGPLISSRAFDSRGADLIKKNDIRGVRPGLPIRLLSGGNLQKALIAREVTQDHCVLIARSPTRGLDVGATAVVRDQILAERDRGIAVLLISEDLDELLALSDRLLVIYEGKIVGEMPASEATAERLGLLMSGHTEEQPA
jgi:simple sugar transport system ATP-binding protein